MSYEWKAPEYLTRPQSMGAEGIQEKAGMAKDELDRHREMQPGEYGHQLGGRQGVGGRQDRLASTCGPMHPIT